MPKVSGRGFSASPVRGQDDDYSANPKLSDEYPSDFGRADRSQGRDRFVDVGPVPTKCHTTGELPSLALPRRRRETFRYQVISFPGFPLGAFQLPAGGFLI